MAVERTFKVTSPLMSGDDVKAWQQLLNKRFAEWKVSYRIEDDKDYGVHTRDASATILYGLGIKKALMANGVTPELRKKVRSRSLSPAEYALFVARTRWRRALKKKFEGGGFASPVSKILQSSWGWGAGHDGVDLICPPEAPIFALCEGEVIDVRSSGWWGLGVQPSGGHPVSHGDGIIQIRCLTDVGPFKKGMHFGYGHAEHARVTEGQHVKAGQMLGLAGFANAWHVHFMVNAGNTKKGVGDRDPMPFVKYALKHG
jgi:murein DD-endopeptidase MepM/ murein hydrolase activator NlpD